MEWHRAHALARGLLAGSWRMSEGDSRKTIPPFATGAVAKSARPPPVVALSPARTRPPDFAHNASKEAASGGGSSHHIVAS